MSINKTNINMLWASLIIEELTRYGVTYFCISPGSRSTPLTAAVANNPKTESRIHFDERGAAFHALGYARATGKPAALICTSGTAVANYLPAVVEASMDGIPMILLTADRPEYLRGTGANQTIYQPGIFSHYVNYEIDLPCPDKKKEPGFVIKTVDRTLSEALGDPPGPVHLNCQFDEPLAPGKQEQDFAEYLAGVSSWLESNHPLKKSEPLKPPVLSADIARVADILNRAKNGLMVVGRLRNFDEAAAVLEFSRKLGWPFFPDVLSGLRLGVPSTYLGNVELIPYYDLLLNSEELIRAFNPDTVLHFGHQVTSKRLMQFLRKITRKNYVRVAEIKYREDPGQKNTLLIKSDITAFIEKLSYNLTTVRNENLGLLRRASFTVESFLYQHFLSREKLSQPSLTYLVSRFTAPALFLASSLPIRDMDSFGTDHDQYLPVGANRGASGIDGTVAAASGFAVGHKRPVTLYIGDLALLHDLNSLALVKENPYPVTVVVVNNGGGNIFQLLPIADNEDIFEKYFLTPHGYDFEKAAAMFDLNYYRAETLQEIIDALQRRDQNECPALIEIKINSVQNKNDYEYLTDKLTERIDRLFKSGNEIFQTGIKTSGDKNNPAILLLHGFMGDKSDWSDTVPYLENDFYTISVDLPGHGETVVNGPDYFYDMSHTAQALLDLLYKLKIKKCHLIGYSMGGRLAQYLLAEYPRRFDKIVLESSSPGFEDFAERAFRMIHDNNLAAEITRGDFKQFLESWYEQPLFEGIKKDPERFEKLLQKRLDNDPEELACSLKYMGSGVMSPLWTNLKHLKNQILFVAGENDDKYNNLATEMSDLCSYSEVCIIKDCGHNVHFEKPQEYAELVKQFLLR